LFVSALLPFLLLRKAVRQRTSTHAPLIPTLTWVQVQRGASRLKAKISLLVRPRVGELLVIPKPLKLILPEEPKLEIPERKSIILPPQKLLVTSLEPLELVAG
jgi:hypothetical protein